MANAKVTYLIPPGSIRCFITGKLRKDTPEENVRQRWARSLVEEYGYPKQDIMIEFPIRMGTAKKRADIVIFKPGANQIQNEITIIVEAKRDEIKASDRSKGEDQLKTYMAASSSCKYGLWVGRERSAFERLSHGEIASISDIPRAGEDRPRRPQRTDLQVAHDLTSILRRCHNYIHANGGLQKAEAFHEMLKLIFCKIYDEEESTLELEFAVDPKEQRSESGRRRLLEDRIQPLFEKVRERYPYIFEEDEHIKLEPIVLAYIVAEMQYVSLLDTETDVKGAAYEELVGQNLRGDRGEYFTPRNVCDMTVKIIQSMFPEQELTNLKVLDCCCGTGGFLVSWIDNLRHIIRTQEERRRSRDSEGKVRSRIRETCSRNLFGLDVNPFLVRTAQMNLFIHGDGSTNVFRVDSTRSLGEWSEEARKKIPLGKADIVLTNPPFGAEVKIDDAHILDRYELSKWESQNIRASMPAEQLFIETAMTFLRGGGILGIVLPDGILNNPSLRFLRSWLLRRARIIASIDLPKETFSVSGGVNNPSVLIMQKFTKDQIQKAEAGIIDENSMVFMAAPRTAGIDKRGKSIFLRHPDGRELIDENGNRFLDDGIAAVSDQFINR
ncbi:MAG: N-6 DNA methylase [Nitrospirae bacterium]|nr:N-6 DNA methylase [Nitrospirota bacterium]